jgi:hypothetical protein
MKFQIGDIVSDDIHTHRGPHRYLIVNHKPDDWQRDEGEYHLLLIAKNVYVYRDVAFIDKYFVLEA